MSDKKSDMNRKKYLFRYSVLSLVFLFLVIILGVIIISGNLSSEGHVSFDLLKAVYSPGEPITGDFSLIVSQGELIPRDSKVIVTADGTTKEFLLSYLIDNQPGVPKTSGEFYSENSQTLRGEGEGYGIPGKRTIYPSISFTLKVSSYHEESASEESEAPNEEPSNGQSEEVNSESSESSDSSSESSSESGDSGITGEVISEESFEVSGVVSKDNDFTYNLGEGEEVEIVDVSVDGEDVDESILNLDVSDGVVTVSTDYSIVEEGFGEEFLNTDEKTTFNIDLSKFELAADPKSDVIVVYLMYGDEVIAQAERGVVVRNDEITIIPNKSSVVSVDVSTERAPIVLGQPVVWTKTIDPSVPVSQVVLELPKEAENVEVVEVVREIESEENGAVVVVTPETAKTDNVEIIESTETPQVDESAPGAVVTGQVTASLVLDKDPKNLFARLGLFMRRIFSTTGNVIESGDQPVEINGAVDQVIVTYETPAPYAIESSTENGKEVLIVGPDQLEYTDVLAFTQISESLRVKNPSAVTLYWEEQGRYVAPKVTDEDGNGIYDYASWNVEHLSNQTFIIEISAAQHLDENRTFVSDIFDSVKSLDQVWSEPIHSGEYVRATFEEYLNSSKDITIYPRIVSGTPVVEVYEEDANVSLAVFDPIISNEYNKIYLTNLVGEQDTFDLRILNGTLEFDHIIDPTVSFNVSDQPSATNNVTKENNYTHLTIDTTTTPYDTLVGYWSFDTNTTATTVHDYSARENDGTIAGNARYNSTGVYAGSYFFDGTGDYITLTSDGSITSFNSSSNFSVSFWFRTNDSSSQRQVISDFQTSGNVGWAATFDSSTRRMAFVVRNGASQASCSFSTFVTDNNWHFFAGAFNRTTTTCALDGSTNIGAAYTGVSFNNTVDPAISTLNSGSTGNNWNGTLDDLMVFNKTLSSTEISDIYLNSSNRFYSRGEQTFSNLNLSSAAANEAVVNLSITQILGISGVNFTVQVGDKINNGYSYGAEQSLTNGRIDNLAINTPENTSLRLIFNADSSRFYTPIVVGNLTLQSLNGTFTCRNLNEANTVYELTSSLSVSDSYCIHVVAENVTIDGKGYTIAHATGGAGTIGINASGINNLTIYNLNVTDFAKSVDMAAPTTSAGETGGILVAINSTFNSVDISADGGTNQNLAGGVAYLYNSTTKNFTSTGGTTSTIGGVSGAGGILYFEGSFINFSRGNLDVRAATKPSGGTRGNAGRIIINYTRGFEDFNTNYGGNYTLKFVNRTGGEIVWVNDIDIPDGVSNITNSLVQRTNFSGVYGMTGLNAHANITFYGMPGTFTNPRILRDGAYCTNCYNFTSLNAATVIFNVTGFSNYSIGEPTNLISSCQSLDTANTAYTLINNLTPTSGTCISVTANNVTLDCAGYSIANTTGSLINGFSSGYNSTTLKNCIVGVKSSAGDGGTAVSITGNYSSIVNVSATSGRTVLNLGGNNNLVVNSTVNTGGVYGLRIAGSNHTIRGSSIGGASLAANHNSAYQNLIFLASSLSINSPSSNNSYTNITFNASSIGIQFEVSSSGSVNNTYTNISFTNRPGDALDLNYDNNVQINGTTIVNSDLKNYTFGSKGGLLTVQKEGVGEILFLTFVNGSGANFSADMRLSSNLASVNSSGNVGLARPANITFYNMPGNFTRPLIFRNTGICTRNCYNFTSLNATTVIFNVSSFTDYSIGSLPLCLSLPACSEGGNCSITTSCAMSSVGGTGSCDGPQCDFVNFTSNATIYTSYDSNGNGNNLTINISGKNYFFSGSSFVLDGDQSDTTGKNAGTLGINGTALNESNLAVYARGSSGITGVNGGNGGNVYLNYYARIRSSTNFTLTAGVAGSGVDGTEGSVSRNRSLSSCPIDVDISSDVGDGVIDSSDILAIRNNYNKQSGQLGYTSYRDIDCSSKLNVVDITRIGFQFGTR